MTDHCYVVKDFGPELGLWSDVDYYQSNVHKMQLPFTVGEIFLKISFLCVEIVGNSSLF